MSVDALPAVEVVGGRAPQAAVISLPADPLLRDRPLADWLMLLPGVHAAERGNGAQDIQLASRGFGARTSFGVRGLRLYIDGIPASSPDGSGSLSHLPVQLIERLELVRGPFSALHGANSGGVISASTRPVRGDEPTELMAAAGAFGERQLQLSTSARWGELPWRLFLQGSRLNGWRPQAAQQRRLLDWRADQGPWRWSLNWLDQPAQDPQGISPAQWAAGEQPPQPQAFDTRKRLRQLQLGAGWRDGGASASAWLGRREVWQWQSIPAAVQRPASHPGGVIALERHYAGLDLQQRGEWAGWRSVLGLAAEGQWDGRQGFENFIGSQLGLTGVLRRDERNQAHSLDLYAQVERSLSAATALQLGLRAGRLSLSSEDRFLSNGDDGGARRLHTLSPVLGLQHRLAPGWRAHLQLGSAQETPTLNELAYRADGSAGFNGALKAQQSRQLEIGLRGAGLQLALFAARSRDEIVVAGSSGGRASFRNAGRGERLGLELGGERELAPGWSLAGSLSLLRARIDGGPLPGAPARQAVLDLRWQPAADWRLQLRASGKSRLVADAAGNAAPGHGLLGLQVQHSGRNRLGAWQLALQGDNLLDRRHAASVIVAEASGRFLEPGAPRRWGLSWRQAVD